MVAVLLCYPLSASRKRQARNIFQKLFKNLLTNHIFCCIIPRSADMVGIIQRQQVPVKAQATLPRRKLNQIFAERLFVCFLSRFRVSSRREESFFNSLTREVKSNA